MRTPTWKWILGPHEAEHQCLWWNSLMGRLHQSQIQQSENHMLMSLCSKW